MTKAELPHDWVKILRDKCLSEEHRKKEIKLALDEIAYWNKLWNKLQSERDGTIKND